MATPLRHKQERFAQEYAVDQNATQAAIRAGYSKKSAYAQGAKLLRNSRIAARVAEILSQARKRAAVTRETMALQFDEDRQMAAEAGQYGAVVAASQAKAKLYGLFIDKRLLGVRQIEDMSETELLEFLGEEPAESELQGALIEADAEQVDETDSEENQGVSSNGHDADA